MDSNVVIFLNESIGRLTYPHFHTVNVIRAVVLNATKMGVYDVAKGRVVENTGWSRKDPRTAFCSSFLAGFLMTCTVVSWT